ncbi:MAG: hypothetical protein V9E83_06970 [Baekduia sp.]
MDVEQVEHALHADPGIYQRSLAHWAWRPLLISEPPTTKETPPMSDHPATGVPRTPGELHTAMFGNQQPPTTADAFTSDERGARDLLAQIQEANSNRAGGWVTTDLAGNPVNDDHTWKDVR